VRAKTVRVTYASSCNHNKANLNVKLRWSVHAAGHNDGRGGYAITQTTTFKRAARIERGKKRRCDVRSNAHDAREIRRRQGGATLKRATVKQNGV
jgi:hypothetical protein